MKYFNEVSNFLKDNSFAQPIGCSVQEIDTLEASLGFSLPEAFKEFLYLMGKDYGGIMVGTNCFVSDIEANIKYLPEFLEENQLSNYILPDKYVVFFCHQGYMMAWFAVPFENEDPICTYYFEGTMEKPEEYGSFSEFMKYDILGNAKLRVENQLFEKINKKWWQFWK